MNEGNEQKYKLFYLLPTSTHSEDICEINVLHSRSDQDRITH
jgi:hypothetical protein